MFFTVQQIVLIFCPTDHDDASGKFLVLTRTRSSFDVLILVIRRIMCNLTFSGYVDISRGKLVFQSYLYRLLSD